MLHPDRLVCAVVLALAWTAAGCRRDADASVTATASPAGSGSNSAVRAADSAPDPGPDVPIDFAEFLARRDRAVEDHRNGKAWPPADLARLTDDWGQLLQSWATGTHDRGACDALEKDMEAGLELASALGLPRRAYFALCGAKFWSARADLVTLESWIGQADLTALRQLDAGSNRTEPVYEPACRVLRAMCFGGLRRYDAAFAEIRAGLELEGLSRIGRADLLVERASLCISLGLADRADESIAEIEEVASEVGPDDVLTINLTVLQLGVLLARADYEKAARLADKGLAAASIPSDRAVLECVRCIALSHSTPGECWDAMLRVRDDPALSEEYRSLLRTRMASVAAGRGESLDVIRDCLGSTSRWTPEGVTIWSECLLDRGAPAEQLREHVERQRQAVTAMLDAWNHANLPETGVGFLAFDGRCRQLVALMRLLVAIDESGRGVSAAFEVLMQAQASSTLARQFGVHAASIAEIQSEVLSPGDGALVYLPSTNGTELFVLDRNSLQRFCIEPSGELRSAIDGYLELLREDFASLAQDRVPRFVERITERGRALGASLIPSEVQAKLRTWGHVTIVGASLLHDLPFEALVLEGGRCLGEECAIDSLGSLPAGLALARIASAARGLAVALAATLVPRGNPDFVPNEIREFDLSDVRRVLPEGSISRPLLAADCTVPAVVDLLSRSPGLVVLIAHGVQPLGAFCVGAGLSGGTLMPEYLRDRRVSGVVMLATCDAGGGSFRPGDDDAVDTLCGALLRSGAHAVIASGYRIEFEGHMTLLTAFCRGYAAGADVSEAMRGAREASREQSPLAPFEHARVQVFGIGHLAPR